MISSLMEVEVLVEQSLSSRSCSFTFHSFSSHGHPFNSFHESNAICHRQIALFSWKELNLILASCEGLIRVKQNGV